MTATREEMLAEIDRELAMRRNVYARMEGKALLRANRQYEIMEAIREVVDQWGGEDDHR